MQPPKRYNREQKNYQTGRIGVWSERSNKFCFGVQAKTKKEALDYIRKKTKKPVRRTQFIIKGISDRYESDFYKGLKWEEDFLKYKEENEAYKKTSYTITCRETIQQIKDDVYKVLEKMKGEMKHGK